MRNFDRNTLHLKILDLNRFVLSYAISLFHFLTCGTLKGFAEMHRPYLSKRL